MEKKRICQTGIIAKDLRALISLQQKHKAIYKRCIILGQLPCTNNVLSVKNVNNLGIGRRA